jgi:succinate-semialdehyde dehydrogenase/glutarate-semialdehyde dehydrogenase
VSAEAVVSPVTGEVLGEMVESGPEGVDAAVARGRAATADLKALSVWERADLLRATANALERDAPDAVEEHIVEHGKTRAQAQAEIAHAVSGLRSTAEYARRLDGRITRTSARGVAVLVDRQPLGVVAAITPWNVPFMVPVEYGAPALAMGNALVWKPAESVPRTSERIQAAFDAAGWPEGAVTLVPGGPATGSALAHHPGIDALCFTGSSEVGRLLAGIGGMRRTILELGGNGPTVVFADADIAAAAAEIVAGVRFVSGQSCAATERVLVERAVHDELLDAVVELVRAERVGDPRDADSTLGPIHLRETSDRIGAHVEDASRSGARVITGGHALADAATPHYWEPTVLAGVTPEMDVFRHETFGPVAPFTAFDAEADVARLAAIGGSGLSSAVFTSDLDRAFRVADALPASHVVVNGAAGFWEMHLPWGGGPGTDSGIGRLGGDHALLELSTTSSIVLRTGASR